MKLSMIYMASGFGKRFGSNKLLASLEGRPLYTYGLAALEKGARILEKKSGISCEIITVSQYPQILEDARRLIPGGKALENPFSEEGITASIRLGVAAAWEDTDAFLFFVADQPYTEGEMIASFADGYFKSGKKLGCTAFNGRRGSPTAFGACYRFELLAISGDKGGRQVMKNHPEELWIMETEEKQLWDVDLPEDLKRGKKEYGTGA